MPIDNDNIQSHITSLETKERELRTKMGQIRTAYSHLFDILQRETLESDPNFPDDRTKDIKVPVDIMDDEAGKKMVAVRRQEIYDHWIAEADTLLA